MDAAKIMREMSRLNKILWFEFHFCLDVYKIHVVFCVSNIVKQRNNVYYINKITIFS